MILRLHAKSPFFDKRKQHELWTKNIRQQKKDKIKFGKYYTKRAENSEQNVSTAQTDDAGSFPLRV